MLWILLAVLLLAVAAVLIVTAVVQWSASVEVDIVGINVDTTVAGIFITGLVAGLLVLGGIAALLVGIQQLRARSKEIEYLRQRVAEQDKVARPADALPADPGPAADASPQADKSTRGNNSAPGGDKGEADTASTTSRREKRRSDRSAEVS